MVTRRDYSDAEDHRLIMMTGGELHPGRKRLGGSLVLGSAGCTPSSLIPAIPQAPLSWGNSLMRCKHRRFVVQVSVTKELS